MKYKLILILLCFILNGISLIAQTIVADVKTGCDSLKVNFSLNPPVVAGTPVNWNFGNGKTSSGNQTPSSSYNVPGKYTVTCLINNILPAVTAINLIEIFKTPSSNFRFNDTLSLDTFTYVFRHLKQADDPAVFTYDWQFFNADSNVVWTDNTPDVMVTFPGTGNYLARLTTSNNVCEDTTERQVRVAAVLKVPNVFTPDGDNRNDYFQVRTNGIDIYIFSVYTRSGVLVYRSESISINWDGRSFSGQVLSEGIYYYTIEQNGTELSTPLKGIIYLFR